MENIKVYIKTNEQNIITAINSSIFLNNVEGYIKIDEGSGDKYAHAQGNYLEKSLIDEYGRFNYKFEDCEILELTEEEKEKLFPKVEPVVEPSLADQIKALKQDNEDLQACVLELASLLGGTK